MSIAYYEIHTILTFGKDLDTICWGSYKEEKTLTFLQELTLCFYWYIVETTKRSVEFFSLLNYQTIVT